MEETPRTDTPDAVEAQPPAPDTARPKAPEAEVFQGVQAAVAAVLVGVAALLVQFSAVHVPFSGSGDDLLCDTPAAHALLTAPEAFPMLPDAPLTVMGLAAAAFITEGLMRPTTCISQGLQSKRSVSFSRPLTSCSGSARTVPCTPVTPLACLGHRLSEKRTQCFVIIRLTSPGSWIAS